MDKRSNVYVFFLLCLPLCGSPGCSTSTHQIEPTNAASNYHDLAEGDRVLVRYVRINDPRASVRLKNFQIAGIDDAGITGLRQNGDKFFIDYREIIDVRDVGIVASRSSYSEHSRASEAAGAGLTILTDGLLIAACVVLVVHGEWCP